jgi:hypothetical protein
MTGPTIIEKTADVRSVVRQHYGEAAASTAS